MPGKTRLRLLAAALVTALVSASPSAALPLRPEGLLDLLPAKVREWLDGRDRQPVQPPRTGRAAPKCGGGIDPNGQPCH